MNPRTCSRSWRLHRFGVALSCAVVLAGAISPAVSPVAGESSADALRNARDRLIKLRDEADAITERYAQAETRQAILDDQVAQTRTRITQAEHAVAAMRNDFANVAGRVYRSSSLTDLGTASFTHELNLLDGARSQQYFASIAARDHDVIERFSKLASTLRGEQASLTNAQRAQRAVIADLKHQLSDLNARLNEAQLIEARYGRRVAEDAAAARRLIRLRQTTTTTSARAITPPHSSTPSTPTTPATGTRPTATTQPPHTTTTRPNGGGGGGGGGGGSGSGAYGMTTCPVHGPVSFSDTWGAPRGGGRTHKGVDMMSPEGTPLVAVVAGSFTQRQGVNQGNGIFFNGDNGNSFWYFHLSRYAGGPRHVQAGEVIGYVGHTGDTTASHLHFEIHPGGGAAINPTPAVRSVC